ncbi:MAG: class II aldolase/adducin family protein [Planctomycetota bacterium]|jgi:rhamnose utilization protein RhaD (predicted bifunctional aldolase and dehydrogenase)|nr:class II aldolase/adducin family protein [Planctomycetota bacterium]
MPETDMLRIIADLSREFGDDRYVRGGGGNTSCKDEKTLWVKPSGLSLLDMTPDRFVAMSRDRLGELYAQRFPGDDSGRESAVARFVASAVLPDSKGRPSVEAPLHNSFPQRYVVHTHPPPVNGMTCGRDGEAACARLFPDALWVPFVEPGYTLAKVVREEMRKCRELNGRVPDKVFLGNHGMFIAHDEADGIRAIFKEVAGKIGEVVGAAGREGEPKVRQLSDASAVEAAAAKVAAVLGDEAKGKTVSGWFKVPAGAISPDHIVYARSYPYAGELTAAGLEKYRAERGYWPRIVALKDAVLAFGSSDKAAGLAMELAWDGAMVERYAEAFGGVKYLDERFVAFIENWEVESYRQKQSR